MESGNLLDKVVARLNAVALNFKGIDKFTVDRFSHLKDDYINVRVFILHNGRILVAVSRNYLKESTTIETAMRETELEAVLNMTTHATFGQGNLIELKEQRNNDSRANNRQ